ncbi:MAG: IclR family transcriptional regulator [Planctomycetota bacterium]|jgi:DNA-binding IclR family transcriptional regulator|nr:IclR family transcriptional regulator [Planctomycetota bacterium]
MRGAREGRNPALSNQSAEKLLLIVETMSALDGSIRLQDLAERLGMNVSTVLRFLAPLRRRGYVEQDPETSRYFMTFKLCGLANNISSRLDLRGVARPFMRHVAAVFEESANLSVESDMSVMYIETVNGSSKAIMAMQRIGHVAPLHCTGVGKIFLLEYTLRKIDQYIAVKGLTRFTEHTITSRGRLMLELDEIRRRGYSFDNEECEEGARCVAAPIRDYTGRIVACVSVSGPASRMTDEHIQANLPSLIEAAGQISLRLDWKGKCRLSAPGVSGRLEKSGFFQKTTCIFFTLDYNSYYNI